MAIEALAWPSPPTLLNGNDGNQDYNLGYRFSVDEAVPCIGLRWAYTPVSFQGIPFGGTWVAALWTVAGETRVRFRNFTPVPYTTDFDVLFVDGNGDPDPFTLQPGSLYVISIFSKDYVYRASGGVEVTSPSGVMQGDEGKLAYGGNPTVFPGSTQPSWYYISPLIDIGGEAEPAEGEAALGLGLAPAATGARASRGSAALGLNLAVSASGTNGQSGRPVTPFPVTPRPGSGYPWTPRPVKSFQEVDS